MIAEIFHKRVDCESEDQLTGNVFGALRYLPYSVARQIIIDSALPVSAGEKLQQALPSEINEEWGSHVHFWKHYTDSRTEPDIIIELGQAVLLIEVKYNRPLSGEDQLIREAQLLIKNYPDKDKFLMLLAREEAAVDIYHDNESQLPKNISFGYITWQRLFDSISQNKEKYLVCEDLFQLLDEKGFGGFRGFSTMNEETVQAFDTVRKSHKKVQQFLSHCIALAKDSGEFELAPMTGHNTFLRYSSDRDSDAWSYTSIIVVFQQCQDKKLKNGYRDGPLYVLELNFIDYDGVPVANIARFDYDNIAENWSETPISPRDHWVLYDPFYNEVIEFPIDELGEMYCGEADEPIERYWGLKRVTGFGIPLSEITADNVYEKVFGTFKIL